MRHIIVFHFSSKWIFWDIPAGIYINSIGVSFPARFKRLMRLSQQEKCRSGPSFETDCTQGELGSLVSANLMLVDEYVVRKTISHIWFRLSLMLFDIHRNILEENFEDWFSI